MSRGWIFLILALLFSPAAQALTGDVARGETLHEKCLNCHGTRLYEPDKRKIKSLKALRKDVKRWGTYYAPALSDQEVEDITAWLNEKFYKF
jgi:cytochrome c553